MIRDITADIEFAMLHYIGGEMKPDKANTMACPFVARKCVSDKCMAWEKDGCVLINNRIPIEVTYTGEKPAGGTSGAKS